MPQIKHYSTQSISLLLTNTPSFSSCSYPQCHHHTCHLSVTILDKICPIPSRSSWHSISSMKRFLSTTVCIFFFYRFILFIYLFIFWLSWVFVAVRGLSLGARAGATLHCGVRASHCGGFFCCRARALGARASVVAARRLSSCGTQA